MTISIKTNTFFLQTCLFSITKILVFNFVLKEPATRFTLTFFSAIKLHHYNIRYDWHK